MQIIRGNRIALRSLAIGDAPSMLALFRTNAGFLQRWDPARPAGFYELAYQQEMIRAGLADESHDRAYTFGVVLQESGELIGRLRLSNVVRGVFQNAYLGYWLDQDHNGQGLMTEAVELALGQGFRVLRLHRVQAATLLYNQASQRVLAKNGFRREGIALRYLLIDGQWRDHVLFAITVEEWEARRLGHPSAPDDDWPPD